MDTNYIFYIANVRLPTEKAHGMQIMKSCEALARAGSHVELIIPKRKNPMKADPFVYYAVERNFTIRSLPVLDTVRFGRLGFLIELLSFLTMARRYMIGKQGVVYTRDLGAGVFFPNAALETHSIPRTLGFFRRAIFRRARAHFVLTSFIKERLIAIGIPMQRIALAPDSVDLDLFDIPLTKTTARERLHLPQDKKIVLYAGSLFLYDWKGVDVFLEAAKEFKEDHLFLLVGGNKEEVYKAKEKWGRDNMLFLGYQPPTSIPAYLKVADVLVIPNKRGSAISEHYTSPLKLFEYMASGRPIVASRLPSLEEVVSEREVAFFEPNDAKDLSRAIRYVFGDEANALSLARNARQKVEAFTWDTRMRDVRARLLELY